jgi:hypothetical protein
LVQEAVGKDVLEIKVVDKARAADGEIVIFSVPPFKAFSETLLNAARNIPTAQVLEISNQTEIQVRLSCEEEYVAETEAWLDTHLIKIITRYQFPIRAETDKKVGRVNFALQVPVTRLMALLRGCGASGGGQHVVMEQVIDCFLSLLRPFSSLDTDSRFMIAFASLNSNSGI